MIAMSGYLKVKHTNYLSDLNVVPIPNIKI